MPDGQQHKPRGQEVFSITSAPESHSSELGAREKRYAISMLIRTLCFVGAVIVSGPLRWILLSGAVFLPYAAVVIANAGVRRKSDGPSPFGPEPKGAIGSDPHSRNEL